MAFFHGQFIPVDMRLIIGRNRPEQSVFKIFALSRPHTPQISLIAIDVIYIINIVGTYDIHISHRILKSLFGTVTQKLPHFLIRPPRCRCNLQLHLMGNELGYILSMDKLRVDNGPLILCYAVKILRLMFTRQPVNGHHADRPHPQSQYQHERHTHGQNLEFY